MSSTTDSEPELKSSQHGQSKPRFTLGQLFPASVCESVTGPNKTGWKTTGIYIAGAALSLGITAGFAWVNQPAAIAEYGKVGQEFFADFVDPTSATSLEVAAFDAKNVEPREFKIAQSDNGQWVIPSHHDYPADAESQLAETASSVIGVERGAMVTRWSADHAQYGVVNPKQSKLGVDQVEGVGQRLTLRGENDSVLADFIVGKKVEGEVNQYYVRHPEEDEVYITSLDIDLSTKFTDWIDTDLFDLNARDVRRVTVNDYSFDELSGRLTESEMTELTREASGKDWALASLDPEIEEIQANVVGDTLNEIASLEITGVRPKQKGLTPDLKLDKNLLKSRSGVERLQADLLTSGFLLQPAEGEGKDQLKLIAREGELMVGTDDGLVYQLYFGRVFTGNQQELEVGFVSTPMNPKASAASGTDDDREDAVAETNETETDIESGAKPGRYVFVSVGFDQELLGDAPSRPTEPVKSKQLVDLEEAQQGDTDEGRADSGISSEETESATQADDKKVSEESSVDQNTDAESSPAETSTDEQSELAKLRNEYETAKSKYETDLRAYEAFQAKIESSREKADALNRRFAKWYYVISGESYEKLALDRSSFVSTKEKDSDKETVDQANDQEVEAEGKSN